MAAQQQPPPLPALDDREWLLELEELACCLGGSEQGLSEPALAIQAEQVCSAIPAAGACGLDSGYAYGSSTWNVPAHDTSRGVADTHECQPWQQQPWQQGWAGDISGCDALPTLAGPMHVSAAAVPDSHQYLASNMGQPCTLLSQPHDAAHYHVQQQHQAGCTVVQQTPWLDRLIAGSIQLVREVSGSGSAGSCGAWPRPQTGTSSATLQRCPIGESLSSLISPPSRSADPSFTHSMTASKVQPAGMVYAAATGSSSSNNTGGVSYLVLSTTLNC